MPMEAAYRVLGHWRQHGRSGGEAPGATLAIVRLSRLRGPSLDPRLCIERNGRLVLVDPASVECTEQCWEQTERGTSDMLWLHGGVQVMGKLIWRPPQHATGRNKEG